MNINELMNISHYYINKGYFLKNKKNILDYSKNEQL